jgi:subtilisin family serine protease
MKAIEDAADAGAQVVSMSLGGVGYSPTLQTAVDYAWQRNTMVVAAAGNDASNELFFPAGANHAVGVSATDSGNNPASFSNFGNSVQLAAPGVGIISSTPTYTTPQNWPLNYASASGTSMATPFVSALAGLVAMTTPNATAQAILQLMEQTASSTTAGGGWGQNFGFGIINASAAVTGTLRPAANGAITGQIVDASNNPISEAQITINNQTIITDLNSSTTTGLYRYGTLPAGTYTVTVSANGYATQSLSATVAP